MRKKAKSTCYSCGKKTRNSGTWGISMCEACQVATWNELVWASFEMVRKASK